MGRGQSYERELQAREILTVRATSLKLVFRARRKDTIFPDIHYTTTCRRDKRMEARPPTPNINHLVLHIFMQLNLSVQSQINSVFNVIFPLGHLDTLSLEYSLVVSKFIQVQYLLLCVSPPRPDGH